MSFILSTLLLSTLVVADVVPVFPGPGEVFKAGSKCTIKWDPDTTGTWKSMSISLVAGSNSAMQKVQTVASRLDGTDASLSPYTWTCPEVDPYSAIYFYQFTNKADSTSAWTTRFTIASPSGETTPPEHSEQPTGEAVPWGKATTSEASTMSSEDSTATSSDESLLPQSPDSPDDIPLPAPAHGRKPKYDGVVPMPVSLPADAQAQTEEVVQAAGLRQASEHVKNSTTSASESLAATTTSATHTRMHTTTSASWMSSSTPSASSKPTTLNLPGANSSEEKKTAEMGNQQNAHAVNSGLQLQSGGYVTFASLTVVSLLCAW